MLIIIFVTSTLLIAFLLSGLLRFYKYRSPYFTNESIGSTYRVTSYISLIGVFIPIVFYKAVLAFDPLPHAWLLLLVLIMGVVGIDYWQYKAKSSKWYNVLVVLYFCWLWLVMSYQINSLILSFMIGVAKEFYG